MSAWPHGLTQMRKFYGTPWNSAGKLDKVWYRENVISMILPWEMEIAWAPGSTAKRIQVHKKCADSLLRILNQIWAEARIMVKEELGYDHDTAFYDIKTRDKLKKLHLNQFGGTFNFRKIHGSSKYSGHSWAASIDIDPLHNAQGDQTPEMPTWVIKIFEDEGWVWGGHWKGKRKDGMHFQAFSGY